MTTQPKQKRQRRKVGIYITKRDKEVLEKLWQYKVLRISTLHRLCFANVTHQKHVQGILKRLVDDEYIGRRFAPRIHRDNAEYTDYYRQRLQEDIYFINRKGVELILRDALIEMEEMGLEPEEDWVWQRWKDIKSLSEFSWRSLNHELDITSIRACLELALKKTPDVELAIWYDEKYRDPDGDFLLHDRINYRDPRTGQEERYTIQPDACFLLEDMKTGDQALFYVECDEGTASLNRKWQRKVVGYREYARRGFKSKWNFAGSGFRVLTVHRSLTGKEPEKRQAGLVETTIKNRGRGMFWFASFDQVMPQEKTTGDHFLTGKIWQRAVPEEFEAQTKVALLDYLF